MGTALQKLKNGFLTLFLKSNCPLCNRPTAVELCEYCQRQLLRCQLSNPNTLWREPLPVFAWGRYGGMLKQAIAALKYNDQPQLARPLGQWLAQAWLQSPAASKFSTLTIIPIPLHTTKLHQRGYNQAQLIAQRFGDCTGYKIQPQGLERIRATEAQFGLSVQAREQNLSYAFAVSKRLSQHPPASPVLLVDDIYTTGATVRSAAKVLQQQGISVCGVVAVGTSQFNV